MCSRLDTTTRLCSCYATLPVSQKVLMQTNTHLSFALPSGLLNSLLWNILHWQNTTVSRGAKFFLSSMMWFSLRGRSSGVKKCVIGSKVGGFEKATVMDVRLCFNYNFNHTIWNDYCHMDFRMSYEGIKLLQSLQIPTFDKDIFIEKPVWSQYTANNGHLKG